MINIDSTRHTIEKIQKKEKKNRKREEEKITKNKKQLQTNNMVPV